MRQHTDSSYWEHACDLFRRIGATEVEGNYFLHNKNNESVKVGIDCLVAVSVDRGSLSRTAGGRTTTSPLNPDDVIFKQMERVLSEDTPCFFVVSPDIYRKSADPNLPLIRVVHPSLEFTFSADHPDGTVSYACDPAVADLGRSMLGDDTEPPFRADPDSPQVPRPFTELVEGWVPDEADERFLSRLTEAVRALQDYPDGKLTLTRAFARRRVASADPFELYALHARVNGEYACSHYFCLGGGVVSVGTTPENVLEVDHGTLTVDVVAATCKYSDDDAFLARELYDNPKQRKEHQSSLVNRQNRFRPFCVDGSIRVVQDMQIKALRNVCHLHSVFVGELQPGVTIFDLMSILFPLLGARPKELLPIADPDVVPHRFYGGVVGHAHRDSGGCFLNIRNALLTPDLVHAKVGVGVLAESAPTDELMETQDKLSGLLEAISRWEQVRGPRRGPAI